MLRAVDSMTRFSQANKAFKKNAVVKIALASLFVLMFVGLKFWDSYAPVSIHDWNAKEISEIKLTDPADLAFAVFGDNKGSVSFFEPLLRDIDRNKEIAFAIDVGDLVGDGKREQYRRFLPLSLWFWLRTSPVYRRLRQRYAMSKFHKCRP